MRGTSAGSHTSSQCLSFVEAGDCSCLPCPGFSDELPMPASQLHSFIVATYKRMRKGKNDDRELVSRLVGFDS